MVSVQKILTFVVVIIVLEREVVVVWHHCEVVSKTEHLSRLEEAVWVGFQWQLKLLHPHH